MKTVLSRFFCAASTALLLIATTSCDPLLSEAPIGSDPIPLVPEEWEGTWMSASEDEIYTLKVTDPQEGRIVFTEAGPEGAAEPAVGNAHMRSFGNWKFLSIATVPKGSERGPAFTFVRFLRLDDQLLFWPSDDDAIRELMESGELPTAADEKKLGTLTNEHLERLTRDPEEGLFSTSAQSSYTRVQRGALP